MTAPDLDIQVDEIPAARRSLRVACVTETYPPEVNGVASTLARIVEGLHERQHDVQLVRPRQAPGLNLERPYEQVLTRGMPIPRYPDLRMGVPSRNVLVRLWTQRRPDVVHIATEGPLGWSALQAARKLRLPVASDFRTNFHNYSRHYGIGWLERPIVAYLRKFHNHTGATMVPTEALRSELAELGFERLTVVGRGVDSARFSPAHRSTALRRQWGAGDDDLVVLYVGRLAAEKNFEALLAAWRALRERDARARLVLVGDGPLRDHLSQVCPEAILAGHQRGEALAAHYASADLFLFPSLTETFGNVTIEALASGLPVVAFAHAAAAQLMTSGVHGHLARPGDTAQFVEAACALALAPAQRRAMAEAARDCALAQDWSRIVQQFEAVLERVMRPAPAPLAHPAPAPAPATA